MPPRKRLIIIGAGFAGLNLAKGLHRARIEILLVDRHNYHLFQPLLYQVATAALSPADIAYPIRRIFRNQPNANVALGNIDRIDLEKQEVCGGEVYVPFDYLAICVGSRHSYFGKDQWAKLAPGLKDLDDATQIRRHVLLAFEEAELEEDPQSRRAKLTFVIVGGGPTGVEMAGALREIAAKDIPRDFRNINTAATRVILVEGEDRLLPQFAPELSERAKKDLQAMGVEIRLNSRVTEISEHGVHIGTEKIAAENVIWAAGVAAPPLLQSMNVAKDKSGRIIVQNDLTIPGHPNVFVLGDAAHAIDSVTRKPIPGLAPPAIQMGKYVAEIIKQEIVPDRRLRFRADHDGRAIERPPFHYHDKGMLATIGTHRAIADIWGMKFGGLLAWLIWSFVHIMFLVGFRNRLAVMSNWIYNYLGHSRQARLITGTFRLRIHEPRPAQDFPAIKMRE